MRYTGYLTVLAIFSHLVFNDISFLGILFSYSICELLYCTCLEYILLLSLLLKGGQKSTPSGADIPTGLSRSGVLDARDRRKFGPMCGVPLQMKGVEVIY